MSALFDQMLLDTHEELIVDLFAGGGGASSGIEQATGRMVDIAINHDPAAVALHQANHPTTYHLISDVFEVNPHVVVRGRPVGFLWASPDCTYHSKARGAKPIRSKTKKRRALAWVVTRWAGQVRPRVIMLENVEEFAQWGPLVGPPDQLRPCKKRRGYSFRRWVKSLTDLGYVVEWRELRACDYGAPTIRKRLYLIARCDGQPIVWPEPTHAAPSSEAVKKRKLLPFRTAAECIDWDIPMLSIFATKDEARAWGKSHNKPAPIRPLAENTQRRIARGIKRFVLDNPKPFLVTVAHGEVSPSGVKRWSDGTRELGKTFGTVKCSGDSAVVAPTLVPRYGERDGQEPRCRSVEEPAPVVVPDGNGGSLVAAHMTTFRSGATGHMPDEPAKTITANAHDPESNPGGAAPIGLVTGVLKEHTATQREAYGIVTNTSGHTGSEVEEPLPTIATGGHHGVMAANLVQYHDEQGAEARATDLNSPIPTIDTGNRHGIVASFLSQHNGGFYDAHEGAGRSLADPNAAVCATGSLQSVVAATLIEQHGTATAEDIENPLQTISAGGQHHGLVAAHLNTTNNSRDPIYGADEPAHTVVADGARHNLIAANLQQDFGQSVGSDLYEPARTVTGGGGGHAGLVASFLAKFYGTGTGQDVQDPLHTAPTIDRFGLVTVTIDGQTYVMDDIAMRMLQPRELYLAQGFRPGYIIDRGADGKPLTKTEQVRMVGNSVSPPVAEALVRANVPELRVREPKYVAQEIGAPCYWPPASLKTICSCRARGA